MAGNEKEQFPVWTQKTHEALTSKRSLSLPSAEGTLGKFEVEVEMASTVTMETTFNFGAFLRWAQVPLDGSVLNCLFCKILK